MDDRSRKVEKTRINVTLTKLYLDALDRLVKEGIYLSRGEVVLEALRNHLRQQGIELKAICTNRRKLNVSTLKSKTYHVNPSLGRLKEDIKRLYEIQDGAMKWWLCFVYPTPNGDSVWERINNLKNMEKERIIWVGERKSSACSILLYQVGGRS